MMALGDGTFGKQLGLGEVTRVTLMNRSSLTPTISGFNEKLEVRNLGEGSHQNTTTRAF